MTDRSASLPLTWRLLDGLESLVARLWNARFSAATRYLLLAPAVLLVGLLAIGLVYIGDDSFRELDTSTYRLSEHYTLVNYLTILQKSVYQDIILRSVAAAVIVTLITLALAFPYAYVMVRTPSRLTRKLLLVSLFLPFFIGQVVRAYGWLIILGKQGLVNQGFALLGLGPFDLIYNYQAVLLGLVQYMLPFAVLMLAPSLTAIPEEVELASDGLGANWPRTLWHVVLPMAKPGLVGASVVVFTLTVTDFAMPEILGGGTIDFIANAIYDGFFQISDAGLGSALAIVLVALGSSLVALIFTLLGAGTLSFVARTEG
ncbi:MAG: ABC transporter permease [Kiloniellales bacterium]|nr:ABC transporter permease [Kiloniellales bacterium]